MHCDGVATLCCLHRARSLTLWLFTNVTNAAVVRDLARGPSVPDTVALFDAAMVCSSRAGAERVSAVW